jgi:hypothetical protein
MRNKWRNKFHTMSLKALKNDVLFAVLMVVFRVEHQTMLEKTDCE